jgi:hypothetical protein
MTLDSDKNITGVAPSIHGSSPAISIAIAMVSHRHRAV